jgi:hypothetical protein
VTDWLLIETFGGHEPTVLAVGSSPRNMVSLSRILRRQRDVEDVRVLLARIVHTNGPVHTTTSDTKRQLLGEPVRTYGGRIHGAFVWLGPKDETPPSRDPAGGWHVNLTRGTSSRSDALLDMFAQVDNRRHVHSLAQLFAYGRLRTGDDEATALAKLVQSRPGDDHQATWTASRDDGIKRAFHFAFRTVAEPNDRGEIEVIGRGISHDIGPAESTAAAPPPVPMLLAERVVAAERAPGQWRAIVNLRSMQLLRWVDEPVPGIAWELECPYKPAIHRRDLATAVRMSNALAESGRVRAELRFRAADGGWMPLHVTANLMLLDQHTTAALVTLTLSDEGGQRIE